MKRSILDGKPVWCGATVKVLRDEETAAEQKHDRWVYCHKPTGHKGAHETLGGALEWE